MSSNHAVFAVNRQINEILVVVQNLQNINSVSIVLQSADVGS